MPNVRPYDPCGHTKLAVSDYKKSYTFYADIFKELGYKQVSNKDDRAGWASPEGYAVLIAQAKITNYQYKFDTPGFHHLCLKYPEYTDKYYAVYFADPDGIKLEVAYY